MPHNVRDLLNRNSRIADPEELLNVFPSMHRSLHHLKHPELGVIFFVVLHTLTDMSYVY